jgi:hypothetical protein
MNDLGNPDVAPVPKVEYDRIRTQAVNDARLSKSAA